MSDEAKISRRDLLAAGLGGAAGLLVSGVATGARGASVCAGATPEQGGGPFYPTHDRDDEDADLTRVAGRAARAAGELVYVRGRVLDDACRPIEGAVVEVWQANTWGRYDHERDADNRQPLDPNFQGWAEVITGADGRYGFKTIKPGSYPADDRGWIRPPHLHFKVSRRGYHELITQMYFAGEPLNEADRIRRELSAEERERVTIEFRAAPPELEQGARIGLFDITLRAVG